MARVSIVVSLWLLLTGGIGEEVLAGRHPRWGLVALSMAVNALTALAVWVELAAPARRRRRLPPRRYRRAYD